MATSAYDVISKILSELYKKPRMSKDWVTEKSA